LFIGSISYSLYLVHFPIILLLKEHFGLVDGITLFAISYAVSLVLSAVLYLSVERPMNDLGKQFCKRLNPRSTKDAVDIRLGTGKR
jgi:peptidoglycan/LPS O-acetylase OafA/YrhL